MLKYKNDVDLEKRYPNGRCFITSQEPMEPTREKHITNPSEISYYESQVSSW
jgi:hypothetical protein